MYQGHILHACMHPGYMHQRYTHHGCMHHACMLHGFLHHGYMLHQGSRIIVICIILHASGQGSRITDICIIHTRIMHICIRIKDHTGKMDTFIMDTCNLGDNHRYMHHTYIIGQGSRIIHRTYMHHIPIHLDQES